MRRGRGEREREARNFPGDLRSMIPLPFLSLSDLSLSTKKKRGGGGKGGK